MRMPQQIKNPTTLLWMTISLFCCFLVPALANDQQAAKEWVENFRSATAGMATEALADKYFKTFPTDNPRLGRLISAEFASAGLSDYLPIMTELLASDKSEHAGFAITCIRLTPALYHPKNTETITDWLIDTYELELPGPSDRFVGMMLLQKLQGSPDSLREVTAFREILTLMDDVSTPKGAQSSDDTAKLKIELLQRLKEDQIAAIVVSIAAPDPYLRLLKDKEPSVAIAAVDSSQSMPRSLQERVLLTLREEIPNRQEPGVRAKMCHRFSSVDQWPQGCEEVLTDVLAEESEDLVTLALLDAMASNMYGRSRRSVEVIMACTTGFRDPPTNQLTNSAPVRLKAGQALQGALASHCNWVEVETMLQEMLSDESLAVKIEATKLLIDYNALAYGMLPVLRLNLKTTDESLLMETSEAIGTICQALDPQYYPGGDPEFSKKDGGVEEIWKSHCQPISGELDKLIETTEKDDTRSVLIGLSQRLNSNSLKQQ